MLGNLGIEAIGGGGRPVASGDSQALDSFRPAEPDRHLLSNYPRHSATKRYAALLGAATDSDRTRLYSAAGPTSGQAFVAALIINGDAPD